MYGSARHVLLRHYLEAGLSKTAIGERLGLDRSTIHRWIRARDLDRDVDAEAVRYRPRPGLPSKLDIAGDQRTVRLLALLRERVGKGMRLEVMLVDHVPREPSGKYRRFISKVASP